MENREAFRSLGWDFEIVFERSIMVDGKRAAAGISEDDDIVDGYESMISVFPTCNGFICDFLEYGFMSTLNTIVECKESGFLIKKKKIDLHEDFEEVFLKGLKHLIAFLENKPIYKEYPQGNDEFLKENPDWAREMIMSRKG